MSSQSSNDAGTVKSIWRYPVKSMNGSKMEQTLVTEGGILGDRAYAVIDRSNGKVASAKHPRKWARLVALSAAFVRPPEADTSMPPVRITLPDGTEIASDDDPDGRLSETVGRPVALTTARPEAASLERLDPLADDETILDIGAFMMAGRFSDYAALHLLTTASLARLSELAPDSIFNARRFRPNLVVATPEGQTGFVENDWVGRTIAVGEQVRLRISDPTPRCSIPTLGQQGLPKDPNVLRTVVQHNRLPVPLLDGEALPCVGVYAFVIQGGTVRRGDRVRVE